jgi:invasion protein IalB
MNGSKPVFGLLGKAARCCLFTAGALALGAGAVMAQEEAPKSAPPAAAKTTGDPSSWVKICTKDEKAGYTQVCLVRFEGLEPKTGVIQISAAFRTVEGEPKKSLLFNLATGYTLVIPTGVQVKIDDGQPVQLQYTVCLPSSCQVQMEVTDDVLAKLRKGKELYVAAMNVQGKTMAFPIPLHGFSKTEEGPPVDNLAYQAARDKMIEAARKHRADLATEAAPQPQSPQ